MQEKLHYVGWPGQLDVPVFKLKDQYEHKGNTMHRLTTITLLLIAATTFAQTTDDTYHLGSAVFAGDFYDVLYHNGYVWIADGNQYYSGNLKVMDVSDPENPAIVASDSYPGGSAFRLDAIDDRLFVSVKGHGVKIYDTSDPLNFTQIGEYETAETVNDMDVLGDLLCVMEVYSGLTILDISDPQNIQTLSQTTISGSRYSLAVTSDSLLSIASGTTGLLVYTMSDPSDPRYINTVTITGKAFLDVVCNDTHAYAVYRQTMINSGGYAVINLTDPPNFEILAQPNAFGVDPFPDNGLFLQGDTLFFAATQGGFGVWDVSDPVNPSRYGGWGGAWLPGTLARWSTRCTAGGGYGYNISPDRLLATTRNEAAVFDLTDLTDPQPLGFFDPPDWVRKAVGSGDYAYVASSTDGLLVLDISDLTDPVIIGGEDDLFLNLSASSVLYENGNAYVSGGWIALKTFDVSNPINPEVVSTLNEGYAAYQDMDKEGALIAVVGAGVSPSPPGWLSILDVSDVANPWRVGFLNLGIGTRGVDIDNGLVYIAYADGLGVIDITVPSNPTLIGSRQTGDGGQDVVVRDNIAYVADQSNGLVILDVSNPTLPAFISSLETPGWTKDIALAGDSIYVADSTALLVIDISDIYNPVITDIAPVEGFAQGVSVDDGRIFLCDKYGFHIYAHDWLGLREIGNGATVPPSFEVACHPNPFNPTTNISFDLPIASYVSLDIYDINGRNVSSHQPPATSHQFPPGNHQITFDASHLTSGIYFYHLIAGEYQASGKMVLMK
jgi:hypothetical protein